MSCTIGIQSIEQVRKEYGAEQANIIAGISGNIISGQVSGDSAKKLSETFGKIMQERESLSINSSDTSLSRSVQLDAAIPASKIAALSSGEFVGMVADNPDQKIELKMFHAEIVNDHEAIRLEEEGYRALPQIRKVSEEEIRENYRRIRADIQELISAELAKLLPAESEDKQEKPAAENRAQGKTLKAKAKRRKKTNGEKESILIADTKT